jgi:hypothetical protein
MFRYVDSNDLPVLPFPTVAITGYAIFVDAIIQYSNVACESLSKL